MTVPTPRQAPLEALGGAPRSEEAEAELLCAVMASGGRALEDLDLAPSELYKPAHEVIYSACLQMHAESAPIDMTTVAEFLLRSGDLRRVGDRAYIADLYTRGTALASAPYYAKIVRDYAARRALIEAGTRLMQLGHDSTDDSKAAVEDGRQLLDAASDRFSGPVATDNNADLAAAVEAIEKGTATLSTPWEALNDLIGGWRRGGIYVVAARPGGGKSIVGLQSMMDAMIRHGSATGMSSMEMGRVEIHQRAFSQLGRVNLSHIIRGGPSVGADEWDRISQATETLSGLRYVVDDRSSATLADIRANITRCQRKHGSCDLYVVDYVQMLTSSGRPESRQVEVAGFSRGLKIIAREMQVPIIVLAQLNRGSESDKREPQMSDLRESGGIEADADMVWLLWREEDHPEVLKTKVPKNRHGAPGRFDLDWEGHYSRVLDPGWTPHRLIGS